MVRRSLRRRRRTDRACGRRAADRGADRPSRRRSAWADRRPAPPDARRCPSRRATGSMSVGSADGRTGRDPGPTSTNGALPRGAAVEPGLQQHRRRLLVDDRALTLGVDAPGLQSHRAAETVVRRSSWRMTGTSSAARSSSTSASTNRAAGPRLPSSESGRPTTRPTAALSARSWAMRRWSSAWLTAAFDGGEG